MNRYEMKFNNLIHQFKSKFCSRGSLKIENKNARDEYKHWPQYLAVSTATLSLMSVGLHFAWTSPTIPKLTAPDSPINITNTEISWLVTILPIGDLIGAPIASLLVDRIGRKYTILLTTLPHITGWLMIAFAKTSAVLLMARFISGFSEGASFVCVPMYIGEIAQPEIRGTLGGFISTTMIMGSLFTNIIGSYLSIQDTAFVCLTFSVLLLITFVWMPESPYYYSMKNCNEKTIESLKRLRRSENINDDLIEINKTIEDQMADPGSFSKLFTVKSNFKAMVLMIGIRGFQQLSGCSIFMYYAHTIFEAGGVSISPSSSAIIYISIQMITTAVGTLLIDKLGRRPLLIFSSFGCFIFLGIGGAYFYLIEKTQYDVSDYQFIPLATMLLYTTVFSVGLGVAPSAMLGELFSANVKAKTLWIMNSFFALCVIFLSQLFTFVHDSFGMYVVFWLYSICCLVSTVFMWVCVPETKGKTLNEIQKWLINKPPSTKI